nr:MAG TPA: hypothetical protein [Bacteriophage sp.]
MRKVLVVSFEERLLVKQRDFNGLYREGKEESRIESPFIKHQP